MKRPGVYDSQLPVTTANQSFDQLDTDGDGVITRAEWEAGVGSLIPVPPAAQPGASGGGGAVMRMRGKSYEVMGSSANVDGGGAPNAPPANMKAARPPRQQAGGGGQTAYYSIADEEEQSAQPNMKSRPNTHRLATQDLIPPPQSDAASDASEHYRNPYKPAVANADSESGVDEHDWEALDRRLKAGEAIGVNPAVLSRLRHEDDGSQQYATYPAPSGGTKRPAATVYRGEAPRGFHGIEESETYTEEVASQSQAVSYKSARPPPRAAGGANDDYYVQTGMKSKPPPRGEAGGVAAVEEDRYQPQSLKSRPPAGRNAAGGAIEEASYGAQLSPRPHKGQMETLNHKLTAHQRQRTYHEDRPSSVNSEDLVRRLDKNVGDQEEYRYTPDVERHPGLTPILLEEFRERLEGMSNEQIRQANEKLRKEISVLKTEVDRRKEDLLNRGMQIAAH